MGQTLGVGDPRFLIRRMESTFDSAAIKFSEDELKVLQKLFKDLERRSSVSRNLDRRTFLRMFHLPGMLGERLFAIFDRKNVGSITYEDLVCGLAIVTRGTTEEKIDFLFRMYDLSGTGIISREDLTTMLRSAVFAAHTLFDGELSSAKIIQAADDDPKLRSDMQISVSTMIDTAFNDISIHGEQVQDSLSLYSFTKWIEKHPESLEILESAFAPVSAAGIDILSGGYNGLSIDTLGQRFLNDVLCTSPSPNGTCSRTTAAGFPKARRHRTITVDCTRCGLAFSLSYCYSCGSSLDKDSSCEKCGSFLNMNAVTFCIGCGFELSHGNVPVEPSRFRDGTIGRSRGKFDPQRRNPVDRSIVDRRTAFSREGYMYKTGQKVSFGIRKRWYVLRDNFLYYFHSHTHQIPAGIMFIEGCFVEPLPVTKIATRSYYGFKLILSEEKESSKTVYLETEQERREWIKQIEKAALVYNFHDYYNIGNEIGNGMFSRVYECQHKATLRKYAVKVIKKHKLTTKDRESLRSEIAIMQLVNHPHVIHLKNVFEHREEIFIVMGLVMGGDLFQRISVYKRFDEDTTRTIVYRLLETVQHLHSYGIVHRDIKPENIMMTYEDRNDHIQVADFGLSKFTTPTEIMDMACGTLAYVAPEVLQLKGYSKKVDVWSIGVVMYILLRGRLPFDGFKKKDVIEKAKRGDLKFEKDKIWAKCSLESKDLIRNCLEINPDNRLSVQQALDHVWFKMGNMAVELENITENSREPEKCVS